jgi:predicted aldo/keto reductase-like oxidoreductase
MKFRKFKNIDFEVSALGFGCMRLPTMANKADIDEPLAIKMIRYAIDRGVNYVDTAYPYHGGKSEIVVGKALHDGYREKIKLATKMPIWDVEKHSDFDRFFNEQLQKLQTDHIDFYLIHNLKREWWHKMRKLGIQEWSEKSIADGRIGYIGFSFHDTYEVFKEIIDSYDGWTFCQIQYNYMNEEIQAGTRGLEYASERGISVIVMEPLLGGNLVHPPKRILAILENAGKKRTTADLALQWLWNKPEVTLVLSGMSTMEQVKQNIESACVSGVGILTQDEIDLIARIQKKYEELNPIPCTKCGYCMPCPNGVDIPRNFTLYNEAVALNQFELNRNLYTQILPLEERAGACVQCKTCEEKCPQSIIISEWMPRIHKELSDNR